MTTPQVRAAAPTDAALIHGFVRDLAEYEKLSHAVSASEADIAEALFGPAPRAFAEIALLDVEPVGFSLWFYTFSTFEGRHGIWLEDLFVRPAARGRGAARALLRSLAQRCRRENLARLEWAVLDWNAPAIAVYDRMDAASLDDWTIRRLTGDGLQALAES
jgi:GNAT superfamily N-acetyltransferase